MRISKALILTILLCSLAACGMGQFMIKRTVVGLEEDIADEFKSFARFTDQQEAAIDDFARDAAVWIRANRMPILVEHLDAVANDIETSAQLRESTWQGFIVFMENPVAFTSAPKLLDDLAALVYDMSDEQVEQATKKLDKEFKKRQKELDEISVDDQHDKLMKGVKIVFKEIDIARTKGQLREARMRLDQRQDYLAADRAEAVENHARLIALLNNRDQPFDQYREDFIAQWAAAEQTPREKSPAVWAHNAAVTHAMMNGLLEGLSSDEKNLAAQNIREYAALFKELSVVN